MSSLLTGVLGLQPEPTVGETIGWLVYLVPMMLYVLWPGGPRPAVRRVPAGARPVLLPQDGEATQ